MNETKNLKQTLQKRLLFATNFFDDKKMPSEKLAFSTAFLFRRQLLVEY